jgi:hypothetical protein
VGDGEIKLLCFELTEIRAEKGNLWVIEFGSKRNIRQVEVEPKV